MGEKIRMVRKIIGAGVHPVQQFTEKKGFVNAFIVAALTASIVEAHKLGDPPNRLRQCVSGQHCCLEKTKRPTSHLTVPPSRWVLPCRASIEPHFGKIPPRGLPKTCLCQRGFEGNNPKRQTRWTATGVADSKNGYRNSEFIQPDGVSAVRDCSLI